MHLHQHESKCSKNSSFPMVMPCKMRMETCLKQDYIFDVHHSFYAYVTVTLSTLEQLMIQSQVVMMLLSRHDTIRQPCTVCVVQLAHQ